MTQDPWPPAIELEGDVARLVPLAPDHADELREAVKDGELWKLWFTSVPAPKDMEEEIARRLKLRAAGSMVPFTVFVRGEAVGMTTYMNIDAANRRLEIGSTWYARSHQKTAVNTRCKRLLLAHAFEALDCIAVEFRTHFFNRESRRAIERLGAKLDGILRSHRIGPGGELRDTCVYSIIASEWPAVKTNLDWRLSTRG
ncbi:MAG: GNAT family N-acetyltransferase [Caulobacteraceae bacterium]